MRFALGMLVFASVALAQPKQLPRGAAPAKLETRAGRLEGLVLADANGQGLRRARVILRPVDTGKLALGVETDDRGRFDIRDIPAGTYTLTAQRDGYLASTTFRRGTQRMPPRFFVGNDVRMTNLTFRLSPWSVITGRIRFEDGDPAVGVRVDLYQQYYVRGRHGYRVAASATTSDRGEYRIHGLAPGAYFAAVVLEGDQTGPQVEDQPRLEDSGRELPVSIYTTTFYPGTERLSEAQPVRLALGQELNGIDIYMRPVDRLKVGGRITDGESGAALRSASVFLERLDAANTGALPALAEVEFDRDDRFHILNVAPGWYQVWVEATVNERRLHGRQTLLLTNASVEDLEIVVKPARAWQGEVTIAGSVQLPKEYQPHVLLEPRSERGGVVDVSAPATGPFDVALMPEETYDVFVMNLPEDFYISQVRALGGDVRAQGLKSSMVNPIPFQIVLASLGGRLDGVVLGPDGSVWSGATVTLIPEPARDRLQDYREAFANEQGRFRMGGIPPGRYILTAWLDEAACDIYDPAGLDPCRQTGTLIDVAPGSAQALQLNIKALPRR
jgi:hypothetical protein